MGNVILHAFNWTFSEISAAAPEIGKLGYSGILVSPPAFSLGPAWYDRYQPIDYRIISSPLGSLENFKSMINELKLNNLKIYIDVVFNHMAHRPDNNLNFPGDTILKRYQEEQPLRDSRIFGDISQSLFSASDFNPQSCIAPSDYEDTDRIDAVHNDRICDERVPNGLPDLNHQSPQVISAQQQYLTSLKNLGADGFRIDAAKHMPVEHIQKVFTPEITQSLFIFGEIIPASHGTFLDTFIKEVNFSAYDFKLFYSLHQAISPDGNLLQIENAQGLDIFRSLTFAVTHDIPNNEAMRQFIFDPNDPARTDENLAYAYILCRDGGVPLVYSDKGEADGLYTNNWIDAYKKPELIKMIAFHNAVFGSNMQILAIDQCHMVFCRSDLGIATINKCEQKLTLDLPVPEHIKGPFRNLMDNNILHVTDNCIQLTLGPRSFQLYLKHPDFNQI